MTTFVGTQSDIEDALQDLVELDYDAAEAYETAINKLQDNVTKNKLREFKEDHERHVRELSAVLRKHDVEVPDGPDSTKRWLGKGKVALSSIMGDKSILSAMNSNEEDTVKAYEKMCLREDKWDDVKDVLKRAYEDEKRHKAWLETNMK